jgi:MFS family permease
MSKRSGADKLAFSSKRRVNQRTEWRSCKTPESNVNNATVQYRNQPFPLLLIIFIVTPGSSIVLPCLVFLVKDFGGNAVIFGILSATYPAFQLIGAPILGRWSDNYGRKKILQVMPGHSQVEYFFLLHCFYPKKIFLVLILFF